jgi:hypothetical protein
LIGILASLCASIIGLVGLSKVVAHWKELRAIGAAVTVLGAVLLTFAAPLVELLAFARMGAIPAVVFGVLCCLPSFMIARNTIGVLERQGTDRVAPAIGAMSSVMGGAIAMFSYVAIAGVFMIIWEWYPG